MQLLADRLIELRVVESITDETVRQKEQWCIPAVSWDFVYRMEDVLDLYREDYDPLRPVVCFDEVSYQLVGEPRTKVPPEPGRRSRVDHEYQRYGTVICLC